MWGRSRSKKTVAAAKFKWKVNTCLNLEQLEMALNYLQDQGCEIHSVIQPRDTQNRIVIVYKEFV